MRLVEFAEKSWEIDDVDGRRDGDPDCSTELARDADHRVAGRLGCCERILRGRQEGRTGLAEFDAARAPHEQISAEVSLQRPDRRGDS